jgi:hypothetical protein
MVFDGPFYEVVLTDMVERQCQANPGHVPVVELHLGDGTTLDLCHIVSLGPTWFAVAYFRNPAASDEVEQAFLPYPLVQWITLSTHPPHVRRIGFDVAMSAAAIAPPNSIVAQPPAPSLHTAGPPPGAIRSDGTPPGS